jgi:hypothetical protein
VRQAQARRTVLSAAAAVVFVFLAFAAALEALPRIRFPEHGHRLNALQDLRKKDPARPLVVVLGSSRTQLAVNPQSMGFGKEPGEPTVFNYGLTGALPVHLPLGLRRLRAAGVTPDAVVVEIFPALLAVNDVSPATYARRGIGLKASEITALAPDARDPAFLLRWRRSRLAGLSHFRHSILFAVAPNWLDGPARAAGRLDVPDRFGYKELDRSLPQDARDRHFSEARKEYGPSCSHLTLSPLGVRAYRELVADCRAAGTPVAFYLAPESPAFRSWYTPESLAQIEAFTRLLTGELGCPVFDTSSGWSEDDFIDGHHLFPAGASRFSRHLAEAHLRRWFATVLPRR